MRWSCEMRRFEGLCFRVRLQAATHLFVCVPLPKQKRLFFEKPQSPSKRERETDGERDRQRKWENKRPSDLPSDLTWCYLTWTVFSDRHTSKNTHRKRPTQHQIWTFSKCGQTSDNGDLVAVLVRGMPWGLGGGFCNWTVNYACWAFHARKDVLVCACKRVV